MNEINYITDLNESENAVTFTWINGPEDNAVREAIIDMEMGERGFVWWENKHFLTRTVSHGMLQSELPNMDGGIGVSLYGVMLSWSDIDGDESHLETDMLSVPALVDLLKNTGLTRSEAETFVQYVRRLVYRLNCS